MGSRKRADSRTLLAYHEAGHAVLSAAINDAPKLVSIRARGETLGHSTQKMMARPSVLVQVLLARFAAEHLLTRRRPRQLDQEVGFAVLSRDDPELRAAFACSDERDGYRAVEEVLRMAVLDTDESIKREVNRFYDVTRQSLGSVWPAVQSVAKALLTHEELDTDGVFDAMRGINIYGAVLLVQEANGFRVKPVATTVEQDGPA
jgi:hypothetical protein